MGSAAVANWSWARTTLRKLPALIAATAWATACSHWGAGRLPSCQRTLAGAWPGTTGSPKGQSSGVG